MDKDNGNVAVAVGDTVRYTGTGSIGKVKRVMERDHELWARVDGTGLWYDTAELEVLGDEFEVTKWNKELTLEELKKLEERKLDSLSHAQQILEVELCESGG
uniref:DUF2098 domain-containing protein n=1 Tax=Candidatus Methanogaster sp. ANME-2c ERB4 TaxID=2759911 RepID=A0A7G9YM57_9EURY|nr:hypothetical protein NIBJONLA_00001 [Methanosarcinales archaeon ANME-2c ERB4]QNO49091.1 hypothetical protein CPECMPGB_00011 [Methanosarcinales archaeon ANME-2c ERB4]QNO49128.1 hypothetical protein DBBAIPCH_00011 [Methanosarcinales archaeon ANME-2c ERB4]